MLPEIQSVGIVCLNGFLRNISCCTNSFFCVGDRVASKSAPRETLVNVFAFVVGVMCSFPEVKAFQARLRTPLIVFLDTARPAYIIITTTTTTPPRD
jgi:hypothetical protein